MVWIGYLQLSIAGAETPQPILDACAKSCLAVEPLAPGCAFLVLSKGAKLPWQIAGDLVNQLSASYPHPFLLGLATSKLASKAAVMAYNKSPALIDGKLQAAKQGSALILAIPSGQEAACLASLPANCLWPLGEKEIARLYLLGLNTMGLIAQVPESQLLLHFPQSGSLIYRYCRGIDHQPVLPLYPAEQLVYQTELAGPPNKTALKVTLKEASASLGRQLNQKGLACRRITLRLFPEDLLPVEGSLTLPAPRQGADILQESLYRLLDKFRLKRPLNALAVILSELTQPEINQLNLFSLHPPKEKEKSSKFPLEELEKRFPRLGWGSRLTVPRREQFLGLIDPYRKNPWSVLKGDLKTNGQADQPTGAGHNGS
ncbi:MAG: hypothetical protein ACOY9Y_08505 [Bacillota bacterium]